MMCRRGLLIACAALACTTPYEPEGSNKIRGTIISGDESVRLYQMADGYVVVHTQQLGSQAGNGVCELEDRDAALAYYEREASGEIASMDCPKWTWRPRRAD